MILHKSFLYEDLMLKKHLVILSMFKTVVLLNIFVDAFFDEYNIKKEEHLFEIGTSFTVPSNLFNASLLNKHIDLFLKKIIFLTRNFLKGCVNQTDTIHWGYCQSVSLPKQFKKVSN